MRTAQSILAIILMITFISCQSVPQNPLGRIGESKSGQQAQAMEEQGIYTGSSSILQEAGAKAGGGLEKNPPETKEEVSKKISLGEKSKQPPKKSPIKPVISPVQTGLLSPPAQEVPAGAPAPGQQERQRIVLNFEKADIAEVTSQIFGDQLKLNYVLDQTLQGRISMYIEGDFDNDDLLQMVIRAYEANGISVIPRKGFYFIQLSQKTGTGELPLANMKILGEKGTRPLIVIYRLRFMDPKQATNLITPFLTPGRKLISDTVTNTVIFVEDTDNARVLVNLLKTIDINVLKEVSMDIVPLSNISPQDAVQGMEILMGKLGGFKESAIKNSLAFLPLVSFGGVLVMAQNPELLKSARQWLQALDVRGTGNQEEIYVYFVQNGLARDIAQIVSAVLGISAPSGMGQRIVPSGTAARGGFGGTSGTGFGSMGGGGLGGLGGGLGGGGLGGGGLGGSAGSTYGGTGSTYGGTGATTSGVAGSTYGTAASRAGGTAYGTTAAGGAHAAGAGTPPKPGGILTGEVMLIPDEVNNAIVIRANAIDYGKIKKAIETLDILPRAVLIEVVIAEVDLTKDFSFGLQYFFQQHPQTTQTGFGLSFGGLANAPPTIVTSTPSSTTPTGNYVPVDLGAAAGQGIALSWLANAKNLGLLLTALSSKTNVTVLASPTLLATDNTPATITVGGEEPIPQGSFSGYTTGGAVYSTIDYATTGVMVNITPHINAGGLVRLELQQTVRNTNGVSSAVGQSGTTAPTFTERDLTTTILAQDGHTVVIGGIINSSNTVAKNGIPWLENIPLLSPLFSSKSSQLDRTELLVAITPHVIDQRGSQAPAELLKKLEDLRRRAGE